VIGRPFHDFNRALISPSGDRTAARFHRGRQAHGGRVFNTAGAGFMLEFGSSLAAIEAAFELAETCEPRVRIGVHLDDVVVQPNGDLLDHSVNVAAPLMARSATGAALAGNEASVP
jgi:class 3 adenylate cyclase